MNKPQALCLLTIAGLASCVAAPAVAQDSYYYFGLGAGKSRSNLDDARITANQCGPGLVINGLSRDSRDNAYKVFLGYQINRNVGVELGYFHLGQFEFDAATSQGALNGKVQVQGGNFDLVGTWPFTENFSGQARVGVQMARTRDTFTGSGGFVPNTPTAGQREADIKVGAGLQYAINPSFFIRGGIERFRINDAVGNHPNVNLYSVSLVFPFGRSADAGRRTALFQTAPYVASTPAPAPVVAMAPAPGPAPVSAPMAAAATPMAPATRRVTYAAETMFSFDESVLRPEGKLALDSFVQELQGTTFDTITVQGYADRLGTDAYNQKLSLQRAEAVKAYLVSKGAVDGGKIGAVGMSERSPVTVPGECKGQRESARLIACLQPDRRVEIEVVGRR
jgi:OOP family OmpA-OmpF porin